MLKLKNISKVYKVGDFEQKALDNVSVNFRDNEFVAILGESGSGKTTTLNIIGGLDRYSNGDLVINGKSTKTFKDKDWDAYRNNSIGFVFQSYNLINHISVLENVEIGMTLSGVSPTERKEKALKILEKVGLKDHMSKKPPQLSGGQKQRVAIARAVANDPDIIMADEPTGALDSETSVEIMQLIKEIFTDKLVIMVTHNNRLAHEYASRVVTLADGRIISDTDPVTEDEVDNNNYEPKRTSMSMLTALKLSLSNLRTKLGRTLTTAFAGSIGIIGVALVLALSNGLSNEITSLETDQLSSLPITITEGYEVIEVGPGEDRAFTLNGEEATSDELVEEGYVIPNDPQESSEMHYNQLTEEYFDYIEDMDESLYSNIDYSYSLVMNILNESEDGVYVVDSNNLGLSTLPAENTFEDTYELVAGEFPTSTNEMLLVVDDYNQFDESLALELSLGSDPIKTEDLIGTSLVVAYNNDFYEEQGDMYVQTTDLENAYSNGYEVTIVGIVREIESSLFGSASLLYSGDLQTELIEVAKDSDIALAQQEVDYFLLTGQSFETGAVNEDTALRMVGASTLPIAIQIYPNDFDDKELIKDYLDLYNEGVESEDAVNYSDLAEAITGFMDELVGIISAVLVAFAAISLVVSSIMIGIITYVSVIERTKEIGVLRSLGASKKDISRLFNAETLIIGFTAGLLGIGVTYLLSGPANMLLATMVDNVNGNLVDLQLIHGVYLVAVSMVLTLVSGLIPARIAAKKDPVEALRSE